jgi:DNA-binding MarR family transcriptional regulator
VVLTLTPAGEQVYARVMAVVHRRNHDILACLSPKERGQLDALIGRLVDHARLALSQTGAAEAGED